MAKERFLVWRKKHGTAPNILYYRDGISESQFGMGFPEELTAIKAAWKDVWHEEASDVKLTALTAIKRHHNTPLSAQGRCPHKWKLQSRNTSRQWHRLAVLL